MYKDIEPKSRPSTNDLQESDSAHYKSVVDCDKPITDRQSKRSEKPMGSSETSSRENNPTKRKRSFTQDEDSAHKKGAYERIGRTFEKLDGRSGTARKDANLRVAIMYAIIIYLYIFAWARIKSLLLNTAAAE